MGSVFTFELEGRRSVSAANTACTRRWGVCAFSGTFHASAFFSFGRRSAVRPSAGNASRWLAGHELGKII